MSIKEIYEEILRELDKAKELKENAIRDKNHHSLEYLKHSTKAIKLHQKLRLILLNRYLN
jgi:hypothetical protein